MEIEDLCDYALMSEWRAAALKSWREAEQKGELTPQLFKDYWKKTVYFFYRLSSSPEEIPKFSADETHVQKFLFKILEEFLYEDLGRSGFLELKKIENTFTACGHVFRYGESTYTCRDCAMDSTCVMCVDCFKNSVHRGHRYKMGLSVGGGCCDCGDNEAWKKDAWCSVHKQEESQNSLSYLEQQDDVEKPEQDFATLLRSIKPAVVQRATFIFKAAVSFAYELLTYFHYQTLAENLTPERSTMQGLLDADDLLTIADSFCTMLYNDESHTYEQVTNAVMRVTGCVQKTAKDLVTQVDREGRALLKQGEFKDCYAVHQEMRKYLTRFGHTPLKTMIMNTMAVLHQQFALDLLGWVENMVRNSKALRIIFSQVVLEKPNSIVEGIMMNYSRMWKFARMQWNRLFFNGLLMEYETKKIFAKLLTRNYGSILKCHMNDDHDQSFSIASLSVQVYTVPSLALCLIEEDEVLYQLLNTFYSECLKMCTSINEQEPSRLTLGGNPGVQHFKRCLYVLYDLRYLLSFKPKTWTQPLRRTFLHGFSMFLKVLALIQGMEPFTRFLHEHAEYEQEWESAFYLHCKLAYVITLMHEWCGEDKVVLTKAYKATLKKIQDHPFPEIDGPLKECRVGQHAVLCLEYDVSRKPMSIHLPLTRMLAKLHLHLQNFALQYYSPELHLDERLRIDQMLEPVLRQQALIAQVHANMWRRNGMNLPNQLQWYANCKCRSEMLDCDIAMLQTAASIMSPDEFIITVLHRFNLLNWASESYSHELSGPEDDSLRQVITLAEELLGLLITVLTERYVPGVGHVTAEQCLCHEIVQQLCIKPMAHSELNQSLHKDFNHETGLENVVDHVADLKMISPGKMVYEVKPERAKEFNLFFYHFTREERSKAEENQRKRRKQAQELECCPPPLPPPFTQAYEQVAELFQCDVMLTIMKNVLSRTINLRNSCFSELQLQETLFIMGSALMEEEYAIKTNKSTFSNNDTAEFRFCTKLEQMQVLPDLLEQLLKCPRIEARGQVPLITWTLGKYRQVRQLRDSCSEEETTAANASASGAESTRPSTSQDDEAAKAKESRSECVARYRARMLEQMQAMQANFLKENASLLADVEAEMKAEEDSTPSVKPKKVDDGVPVVPVAIGPARTAPLPVETRFTCILCQATELVGSPGARPMVMAALVQQSTVLCRVREPVSAPRVLPEEEEEEAPMACAARLSSILTGNLGPAPHVNSCGHKMHTECCIKYYENMVAKEARRSFRRFAFPFDLEKQEFMCPLCNNLSNCALPVFQPLEMNPSTSREPPELLLKDWTSILEAIVVLAQAPSESKVLLTNLYMGSDNGWMTNMSILKTPKTATVTEHFKPQRKISLNRKFSALFVDSPEMDRTLLQRHTWYFIEKFDKSVVMVASGQKQQAVDIQRMGYAWQTCAYTIHALEWLQRDPSKALLGQFTSRQEEMLRALILTAATLPATVRDLQSVHTVAVGVLGSLLQPHKDVLPCILEWDAFGMVVSLTLSMPYLFMEPDNEREKFNFALPTCGIKDVLNLRLVLLAHMMQLMIGLAVKEDENTLDESMDVDQPDLSASNEGREAIFLYRRICLAVQHRRSDCESRITSPQQLWHLLTKDCIPFLRCCAIFFRYLSGVADPEELTMPGGDTFPELCRFLGIPSNCKQVLDFSVSLPLQQQWCSHENLHKTLMSSTYVPGPVEVNQLASLPKDFMELINSVSIFKCPYFDEESRNPTLCLVCGKMVCMQSYCCQAKVKSLVVGPSMHHAYQCSAGVGVLLRVRECEVVVLNHPHRGCFLPAPYVDKYGETDEGLRRGNPLYLCSKSYQELQTMWLSHGLTQAIGRNFDETSQRLLTFQWRAL